MLPNHGDPDLLAAGGYGPGLLSATRDYIRVLQRCREQPELRELTLREVVAAGIESGALRYFGPYEAVHRHNVATAFAALPGGRAADD